MRDLGPALCEALARALDYPAACFNADVETCLGLARAFDPAIGESVGAFAASVGGQPLAAMEELYIQTFDFNPNSTLDLGWQLFAEDYNRGLFLAKLRAESRRVGVAETCELPDHLPHVLRVLARMEPEVRAELTRLCVLPALEKTLCGVPEENPYRHLLQSVIWALERADEMRAEVSLT